MRLPRNRQQADEGRSERILAPSVRRYRTSSGASDAWHQASRRRAGPERAGRGGTGGGTFNTK